MFDTSVGPTLRSSRLAGRGPGLTGDRLLGLGYEVLTGEEELLLAALGGPLELHGVKCSPLDGERRDPGVRQTHYIYTGF